MSIRVLIIGGTGMLKDATSYLIGKGFNISIIGRDRSKIDCEDLSRFIEVDYHDKDEFLKLIVKDILDYGVYDIVICWMHSSGNESLLDLLDLIIEKKWNTIFYHILGSRGLTCQLPMNLENVDYRQIQLGFKVENGHSRWLTHSEISTGVIEAFYSEDEKTVVGLLEMP